MIKSFFALRFIINSLSHSLFVLIFFAGIWQSCNDDAYNVGIDLMPDQDIPDVKQVDTLDIQTYNIGPVGIPVADSLVLPLGTFSDEVFGTTKASFMVELTPETYLEFDFGSNPVVDSVYLVFYYDEITGDSSYTPQLEVYYVTERIEKTAGYFTDTDREGRYNPDNLVTGLTDKTDSISRIRVVLDNELGDILLNTISLDDSSFFGSYKIDSVFDNRFYGLHIATASEENARNILGVSDISVTVKYHNDEDTSESMSYFYYPVSSNSLYTQLYTGDRYIKFFEHDYSGSAITQINDSTSNDSLLFLQSLGGTQAILEIHALEQLRQTIGRVSVNHAELIIPVTGDTADLIAGYYPKQLGMRIMDDTYPYLPDDVLYQANQYVSIVSYMNGRFSGTDVGYKFNMTAYFHEYLKGNINSSMIRIFAGRLDTKLGRSNFNPVSYNSLVLAGSGNQNRKITLKLVYTKL